MSAEPYRDTSVSVSKSKAEIEAALRQAGARGLALEERWGEHGEVEACVVRFLWPLESGLAPIRHEATPLAPEPGARGGWKVDQAQRERQAWRGLSWYLTSLVKAAAFGTVPFEAVFLAYFEGDDGKTLGEVIIPRLEQGLPALGTGRG